MDLDPPQNKNVQFKDHLNSYDPNHNDPMNFQEVFNKLPYYPKNKIKFVDDGSGIMSLHFCENATNQPSEKECIGDIPYYNLLNLANMSYDIYYWGFGNKSNEYVSSDNFYLIGKHLETDLFFYLYFSESESFHDSFYFRFSKSWHNMCKILCPYHQDTIRCSNKYCFIKKCYNPNEMLKATATTSAQHSANF